MFRKLLPAHKNDQSKARSFNFLGFSMLINGLFRLLYVTQPCDVMHFNGGS